MWDWFVIRYPAFITLLIRVLPELIHKRNCLLCTCQVYLHSITWYHDGLPFRTSLPFVFYDSRRGWPRWTREPAESLWWPPRSFQLYLKLEYDFNRISRKKKTYNTWLRTENMAYIHGFISLHVLTFRRQISKAFVKQEKCVKTFFWMLYHQNLKTDVIWVKVVLIDTWKMLQASCILMAK